MNQSQEPSKDIFEVTLKLRKVGLIKESIKVLQGMVDDTTLSLSNKRIDTLKLTKMALQMIVAKHDEKIKQIFDEVKNSIKNINK